MICDRVRMFFVNDYPSVNIAFYNRLPKYLSGLILLLQRLHWNGWGIDAISNTDDAARYFDQLNKNYIYGNGTSYL